MENSKKNDFFFSIEVTKIVGIYQIIFPDNIKIFGYNIYHIIVSTCFLITMIFVTSVFMNIRFLAIDKTFLFYIALIEFFIFIFLKISIIMYKLKDIWKLLKFLRFHIMKYEHYDINLFKYWQKKSTQVTSIYLMMFYFIMFNWILFPYIFKGMKIPITMHDGSYKRLPLNIYNLNFMASEEFYIEYFNQFYFMEIFFFILFANFNGFFDILVIIICIAFIGKLNLICKAIEMLGEKNSNFKPSK